MRAKVVEINSLPKQESELYKKAENLIEAAYDYFQEFIKQNKSLPAVWLKDDGGSVIVISKAEYLPTIMKNI